ncbi:MAG: preprotein translocase subunit SecG [Eubacteriales bacterium]|nr:preprotein translocase subunit SecG [Eubacteriales bacterium]
MSAIEIIIMIFLMLASLAVILAVLLQPSRSAGISGVIGGGAETFFGKNKAKSFEGKLITITKISSASVFVLCLVMALLMRYL